MTTLATPLAATPLVHLDCPEHGLAPAGGSRDLDALVERARDAEAAGATVVVLPPDGARDHWPATARALAVLLATTSVLPPPGEPGRSADR